VRIDSYITKPKPWYYRISQYRRTIFSKHKRPEHTSGTRSSC